MTEIPILSFELFVSHVNWGFRSEPTEDNFTSSHFKERSVLWPRGKVLGGTSSFNAQLYVRGNKKDYDSWQEQGNDGWSFEDVLPYFKKSEDNRNEEFVKSQYHSTGGSLTVDDTKFRTPMYENIVSSCSDLLGNNPDYNGERQTGCFYYQNTIRNGQRCSTAKAFLKPKRSNLHVSPFSHVHKINIDPKTKKVTGVLYKKEDKLVTVAVRKEVILSAGVIGSAQVGQGVFENFEIEFE